MRGFKFEVIIDEKGAVKSNLEKNDMELWEIVSFLEMQKFLLIKTIVSGSNPNDFVKAEIIEDGKN